MGTAEKSQVAFLLASPGDLNINLGLAKPRLQERSVQCLAVSPFGKAPVPTGRRDAMGLLCCDTGATAVQGHDPCQHTNQQHQGATQLSFGVHPCSPTARGSHCSWDHFETPVSFWGQSRGI